jgi:hypothetical protein
VRCRCGLVRIRPARVLECDSLLLRYVALGDCQVNSDSIIPDHGVIYTSPLMNLH